VRDQLKHQVVDLGSIPGIWLGSRLAQIVPTTPLRYALSVLLMCVGVKLLVS
jgi:uncharacterized membrane protein YfcA